MKKLAFTIIVLLSGLNLAHAETISADGKLIKVSTDQEPSAEQKKLNEISEITQSQNN